MLVVAPGSMKMWKPLVRPLTPERRLVNRGSKIAAEDSGSHFPVPFLGEDIFLGRHR